MLSHRLKILPFVIFHLLSVSALKARANSIVGISLLQGCEQYQGFKTNCQFVQAALTGTFKHEMKFSTRYVYACVGHPINVGLSASGSQGALLKFEPTDPQGKLLEFVGVGPVQTVDRDELGVTSAEFAPGCDLRLTEFSYDLSDGSKHSLDRMIVVMSNLHLAITNTKTVESLSASLKTLLMTIDVPSMAILLRTLYYNTKTLADSYASAGKVTESNAILDVLDELKSKICDNPPTRAANGDVCGSHPAELAGATADTDKFRTEVGTIVREIGESAQAAVNETATLFASTLVDAWSFVAEATEPTSSIYRAQICSHVRNSGLSDPKCS